MATTLSPQIGEIRMRGIVPVTFIGMLPGSDKVAITEEPWGVSFPSHGDAIRRGTTTLEFWALLPLANTPSQGEPR